MTSSPMWTSRGRHVLLIAEGKLGELASLRALVTPEFVLAHLRGAPRAVDPHLPMLRSRRVHVLALALV